MNEKETRSVGERLQLTISNLWQQVNSQEKVLDHHGLKISKGTAVARNGRLRAIAEAGNG